MSEDNQDKKPPRKPLSREEINKIMNIFIEAKAKCGQKVETAILIDGDNTEILVDNRDPEKAN